VKKIIQSGIFYPCFITGLSGNGKTKMVEQACASVKRELFRVNLTIESDEDSLTGGFRLENGSTVWFNGPVIEAMERGAILLLDEIDLASPTKIMCLQSILEGNGYLIKKIGKVVKPSPGFNIIATANTKMQGDSDGRFIGTNIMNSAMIDRFSLVFEQDYPTESIEKKIIMNIMKSLDCVDEDFAQKLVTFAFTVRKTYNDGGCDSVVTSRKLIQIIQAYSIFGNRIKAIELTMNIFDQDTRDSFVDLYKKIDADVKPYEYSEEENYAI
jgi:MoxR-like ATPase